MSKEINSKSKKAFFWDLSGAFARQFVSFFISIILARLLGPEEYGLIAIAMIVVNISGVFTDAGFSSALIQKKNVEDVAYSSVFYLNLGLSFILSFIIILVAPVMAIFFEDDALNHICMVLALIPPLSALGSVHTTMLSKELDFKSLTVRNIVATIIAGVIAVIAAFSGAGVYSLVIQQVLSAAMGTLMVWLAISWKPKWEFSIVEVKKLFHFSGYVFLDNIIRRIFLNIDSAFIGKMTSPVVLGFYNRAQSLKSQVDTFSTQSLSKVIFPVFSKLQHNDGEFKSTYHKSFKTISGIMVLLVAPFYILANFLIINLLGEQWERSVQFFQILVLGTLVSPHVGIMSKALLAKGLARFKFKIGLIQRFMMLLPIIIGYYKGMNYFTLALVGTNYVVFVLYLMAVDKKLHIDFWKQLKSVFLPNFIFFGYLILDYFYEININSWLLLGLFFGVQLLYLKLLNHQSLKFLINTANQLFKLTKTTKS